jgi:integrase/recombinase XerD
MSVQFNKDPLRRALKLDEWPPADRAAWERARAEGDVLEPGTGGLASQWRDTSARTIAKAYGRFLCFLDRQGLLDKSADPATRLNPEVLRPYLDELGALNASGTVLSQVRFLNCGVKAMFPGRDWNWMRRVIQNLAYLAEPVRDKRNRIVPIEDLLDYGLELMAKAEAPDGGTNFTHALLYRDGLIIAILAVRPFREANMASIVIGRHLLKRGTTYWLCFAGHETKNHQPIELPVPEVLNPHIERYCNYYRPVLFPRNRGWTKGVQETGAACAALWLSSRGNPMPANTLYERVVTLTQAKFGHAITPHDFRGCAATSIVIHDPDHVRIAARLLGHSRLKTTERYYIQAQSFEASRRYQHEIEARRAPIQPNQVLRNDNAQTEMMSLNLQVNECDYAQSDDIFVERSFTKRASIRS